KVVYKRDDLEGYAFFDMNSGDQTKPRLRLLEMHTISEAARRGLIGYLAKRADEGEAIEYTAGLDELTRSGPMQPMEQGAGRPDSRLDIQPGVMFRIIDLKQALKELTPNYASVKGEVTFVMEDSLAPSRSCLAVTVEGDGQSVDVRLANGVDSPRKRIEGDV